MKLIVISLLTTSLGLGWFGLRPDRDAAATALLGATAVELPCSPDECDATVTCLPGGKCLIECEGPDGQTCSMIVECPRSEDCAEEASDEQGAAEACDAPCERSSC